MSRKESELILNDDGSIYHVNLKPEDLADLVIFVGDPDRVPRVSKYFDEIEFKKQKREIVTHTGSLNGKRMTAISTGMGPDNIDIVLSELDALANMDLKTGKEKETHRQLKIVRLGTSGALHRDIPVDSYVISSHGMGFDGLLHFYKDSEKYRDIDLENAFMKFSDWDKNKAKPYVVSGSKELAKLLDSDKTTTGITATAIGFYGPQGRYLRLLPNPDDIQGFLGKFKYQEHRITNFEMETSAIYGLAKMLGHKALSLNCIIANRDAAEFSKNPHKSVDKMIQYAVKRLTK